MVQAFAILLVCQLAGESLGLALAVPVPGPVIGLVILAVGLAAGRRLGLLTPRSLGETALGRTSDGLLRHLSLLFVPAGVGIVQQGGTILGSGPAILVALVASTVLTLIVSAGVFVGVMRLTGSSGADHSVAGDGAAR